MERLGHMFINLQQVRQVPWLLRESLPSVPSTLRASEVPPLFRVPSILSGYRPPGQPWRYYALSVFLRHNETVNVWTHLLGALCVLFWALRLGQTVDFVGDVHAWPLLLLVCTAFGYLALSTLAHLLSARSPLLFHVFYFLDYLGIALYQYGSAAAHLHYAAQPGWRGPGGPGGAFLGVAALLAWLSCLAGCCSKLGARGEPSWGQKLCHVVPCGLAYAWDSGPVFHRVYTCLPVCADDPAGRFHAVQLGCFLASAVFFSCGVPERWLPGRCDFLPQGHQLFHLLMVLCTCGQIHGSHLDYLQRRALYTQTQSAALLPGLLLSLFALLALTCILTCVLMTRTASRLLGHKHKES
ncbi:membrane progestin receptor alpha-B-like [Conger conger]|uniref:membrane progestin receptor alpha-B-like n=1 Tax=Conger conger TaxID=82655 RepID=UPI002A5AF7CC|nr:membrane progestin receptor alpha-B-like [Conger conger]XP_061118335.1 membrane progestin receptor alpha-B-like [Conger conger]XP_061118343.1 membrane progestin receptor alpha-B-like [Conger conger]